LSKVQIKKRGQGWARSRRPLDKFEEHPVTFFRLTDLDWDEKRVKFEEALQVMEEKTG